MSSLNQIEFCAVTLEEKQSLAKWLASDVWDNFSNPNISMDAASKWVDQGAFHGEDKRTFWICLEKQNKVGLVQIYDLLDSTAMFDMRINTNFRGLGIGRQALKWLTNYAFENFADITRIEANTRQDNIAMRKVLRACGFVKEAHYRAGWTSADNPADWVDSVAYAILRYDWANHTTTPVQWNDEP